MPKVVDHVQYRKQLLGQAFEQFARHGYGQLTMRQLAQELNVSTGTLYHYFPSKETLFIQLIEELTAEAIGNFVNQAPTLPDLGDRLAFVTDFVLNSLDYFAKQEILWIEFTQHQHRSAIELPAFVQTCWKNTRDALQDYLKINDTGRLDFILVFLDGLLIQRIYGYHDRLWFESQCQLLHTMFTAPQGAIPTPRTTRHTKLNAMAKGRSKTIAPQLNQ
jgi:AcrR family transcriptional regulator